MTDAADRAAQVVVNILLEHKTGWLPSRIIARRAAARGYAIHTRVIGEIAQMQRGSLIGGGAGYKHAKNATPREILECYSADMKRSLGTEQRARDLIRYARSHGLLSERYGDEELSQIKLRLAEEIEKSPASALSEEEQEEAQAHEVKAAQRCQVELFAVVEVPADFAEEYFARPVACFREHGEAEAYTKKTAPAAGARFMIWPVPATGQTESPTHAFFDTDASGSFEQVFTDEETALEESKGAGSMLKIEIT